MKEDKLRLFIAIELPSNIIDGLRNVQEELKDKSNKLSWAKPENIHLTLKFLGDTETGKIDRMVNILEGIAGRSFSFEISVKGVGTFPAAGNPRVIWVGIEENKDMLQLYNNIEEGLATLGFEKEMRDFKPHITLGRIKFLNDRAGLKRR
ncbi:MAG: RNA 2',3'-cyclic phosphodiesterase, partial [Deltaproteobacteria bacterium]